MARTCAGGTQYLENATAVLTGPPLTIAAWCFRPSGQESAPLAIHTSGSGTRVIVLDVRSAFSNVVRLYTEGATVGAQAVSGSAAPADAWFHVAGVYGASNSRTAFLDGVAGTTNTTEVGAHTVDLTAVSSFRYSGSRYNFNSTYAEIGLWNVVLDAAELAALAKGFSPALIRPGSLVAYWPLIGRNSPELDLRGNAPLTVTGATAADHCRVIQRRGRRVISVAQLTNQTATAGIVSVGVSGVNPTATPGGVSLTSGIVTATTTISDPALFAISTVTSGTAVVTASVVNPLTIAGVVFLISGTAVVVASVVDPMLSNLNTAVAGVVSVPVTAVDSLTIAGAVSAPSGTVVVSASVVDPVLSAAYTTTAGVVAGSCVVISPTTVSGTVTIVSGTVLVSAMVVSASVSSGYIAGAGVVSVSVSVVNPAVVFQPVVVTPSVVVVSAVAVTPMVLTGAVSVIPGVVTITIYVINPDVDIIEIPPGTPEDVWRRGAYQIVRVFAKPEGVKRVFREPSGLARILRRTAGIKRVYPGAALHTARVWRFNGMALAKETLYLYVGESKTFGFDYSLEGAIQSGETITDADNVPEIDITPVSGSAPTAGTPAIITADFYDSDGTRVKANKGTKCRFTGIAVGEFFVICTSWTSGGDKLIISGKLIVEEPDEV